MGEEGFEDVENAWALTLFYSVILSYPETKKETMSQELYDIKKMVEENDLREWEVERALDIAPKSHEIKSRKQAERLYNKADSGCPTEIYGLEMMIVYSENVKQAKEDLKIAQNTSSNVSSKIIEEAIKKLATFYRK